MTILHTFSIVARDSSRGELGVAVQTHWFAVGGLCPWIEAGVGAVATQAMVEIGYGPGTLDLLRQGYAADQALDLLLSQDSQSDLRQVAVVDARGGVAVHTGRRCVTYAGHQVGEGVSVQANMMTSARVWPDMMQAYQTTEGSLAERMLAALQAGQAAGGDIRGQQSAAILVASGDRSSQPWRQVRVNLRVDDHPCPINELQRLIKIQRAYQLMKIGDSLLAEGNSLAACQNYQAAAQLAEGNDELLFWGAVGLADNGLLDDALPQFQSIFKRNPQWVELVKRLPAAGLLKDDPQMMDAILKSIK